ncbi:MATH domain and coiled-coil domain-containing protein [Hirschfeldia incana]|nr:MATH domain and coiled-coil domain-containing protein [Hirschfeldia incana]
MEKKFDKKFTWVIKDFSSLKSLNILSDIFVVRGCKWHLNAYPKGNKQSHNCLSLFLEVAGYGSLLSGWRRHVRYRLVVVNQRSETLSRQHEVHSWFEEKAYSWGFPSMLSLDEINAKDSGFLVNGELKIVVEIELLEIIGKVDVNGFHLLSSQVETVSRMFEKHPETASEVHLKNPNLRTGYMNLLLSLIDTLCQSPHKLPKDDLDEAHYALESLTDAGFKLDWLEKKISQVSEMKEKDKDGESRRQDIEKELKYLKQKCSDLEALLEKEKSEALAAKAPFSFDDIIQ